MVQNQVNKELRSKEKRLINRYSILSKFLLLLTIVFVVIFLVIFMGTHIWNYGSTWAILSFDT